MANLVRGRSDTRKRGARRRLAGHRGLSAPPSAKPESHNRLAIVAAVIAAFATFLASVGGLYFSAQASLQATKQAQLAQDAQTTERFSRSVEQLGSDSVAVRIGGVYSFDKLMHDSPSDQQAIVKILSNFISFQAKSAPVTDESNKTRSAPADFLTALNVLDAYWAAGARGDQPSMLLTGAKFSKLVADSPSMRGADLTGADLTYASLRSTDLTGAHLPNADLSNALMLDSKLIGADLNSAYLNQTNLSRSDLSNARLRGAYLTGTNLTDAHLNGADLNGADTTDVTCSATTKWPEDFTAIPPCN